MHKSNSNRSKASVAYLGPPSSYTHQATIDSFDTSSYELRSQITIQDVFAAVQSSATIFGVVPFENSSNGPVLQTLDHLIDRERDFPDIRVCGEAYLDVQHCLLGRISKDNSVDDILEGDVPSIKDALPKAVRSKPKTDLSHLKAVVSHPQALGQCEKFLNCHLKGIERLEVSSTSEAAKIVAEDRSGTTAAISSSLAGELNGLDVLAESIQDEEENSTRFVVMQRGPSNPKNQLLLPEKLRLRDGSDLDRKVLIVFSIDHSLHGALASALQVFKKYDLNLTSINPRPSRIRPWHYMFLVEFNIKTRVESPVVLDLVMKELDTATEENTWLGCWMDSFGHG